MKIVSRPNAPVAPVLHPRSTAPASAPAARSTSSDAFDRSSAVNAAAKVSSGVAPGSKGKVLMLLPENGGDPGETAIPYAMLKAAGYQVVFATASGRPSKVDTLSMRSPFLKLARPDAEGQRAYQQMIDSAEFKRPVTFDQALARNDFTALLVPGGEGPGMVPFVDDRKAQDIVRKFHAQKLPSAFLCHGGLLGARTLDPATGKSVIHGQKVTTVPKLAEKLGVPAFLAAGRPRVYGALGGNFAADELARAAGKGNFVKPAMSFSFRSEDDTRNVTRNANTVFGGGPWDSRPFAKTFIELLDARA